MLEIEKTFVQNINYVFPVHETILLSDVKLNLEKIKNKKSIHLIFKNNNDLYKDRVRIDFYKGFYVIFHSPKLWLPQSQVPVDFQCYQEKKTEITINELKQMLCFKEIESAYFKIRKKYYYKSNDSDIIFSVDKTTSLSQNFKKKCYLEIESNAISLINHYQKAYLNGLTTIKDTDSKWFNYKIDPNTQEYIYSNFADFETKLYQFSLNMKEGENNEIFRLD